ncbi:sigma-54-dependent Fis family transcriptional regulator [Bacillus methanolicus]|nr:sigma-54-dependent Fis family transcriptional regulator [Bacillus methanolicus]
MVKKLHKINMTKEVLGAILKSIDEGIHVVNIDGITIFYNEVAAKHDGLEVEEVIGKPLLDIFPSLNEKTSTLLKVTKTKKPIYNQTQSYVNMHGKRIETINTTLPIIVDGKTIGAVEIAKDYSRLKLLSERLLDLQKEIKRPAENKQEKKTVKFTFENLLTKNPDFQKVKDAALKLASSDSPILVYGESGTGKELFVQGIHYASRRASMPFIAQNCAAIPETLLESMLFGTAKGSYTGAVDRPGLFELADKGTLFLDEIHTMPIELQAKLLRVLEEGSVRRVGGANNISVDTRVIAAMNIHPQLAVEKEKLRSDLFYRLNVLAFELLPLRERPEDIMYLTRHFIETFNNMMNKAVKGVDEEVSKLFTSYRWPGNVRELKHTVEYMMNICEGEYLTKNEFPIMLKQQLIKLNDHSFDKGYSLRENVKHLEIRLVKKAMAETAGNINQAARLLGIPRQTLQYKLQKYSLTSAE